MCGYLDYYWHVKTRLEKEDLCHTVNWTLCVQKASLCKVRPAFYAWTCVGPECPWLKKRCDDRWLLSARGPGVQTSRVGRAAQNTPGHSGRRTGRPEVLPPLSSRSWKPFSWVTLEIPWGAEGEGCALCGSQSVCEWRSSLRARVWMERCVHSARNGRLERRALFTRSRVRTGARSPNTTWLASWRLDAKPVSLN